ncbi:hypothetical protein B0T16DRAFT_391189 [Cercophora newfieldiana]|uniref:Yeast cell wall synthesis Kre9/Knh1-like N-terminal domain-containing protein n=1 Tax=Cercophora newfieldiana TaxID=92897 RepID=A0AA39Y6W2_9PEZI|nr:hypothetical protein B0T16DRAFT_391189 [Cercophora newfieldiana]
MQSSVLAAVLLAACARAIEITSPAKNEVVDLAAGVEVKWTTVSSDPKSAHLFLVNMAGGHTPFSKDLGEIDLNKGSITVKESVEDDSTYQFNFQSLEQHNTGILAQSQQFEAKAEEDKAGATTTTKGSTTKGSTTTAKASATAASAASEETAGASTTFSSVVVSASASGSPTKTGSSQTANASSDVDSAASAVQRVGGMLALVAGVVAVLA